MRNYLNKLVKIFYWHIKSLLLILSQEMKSQNCLSPIKQNLLSEADSSPTKFSGKVPLQLIRQILGVLNSKNISLPGYLDKKLKGYRLDTGIKLQSIQTNVQQEEMKKIKIKLNDLQFQKKKLQEDFAQYRHNSKTQRQKQVRKLEDSCQQLKNFIQDHKESSLYKLQNVQDKYSKDIQELKDKHARQLKQITDNLTESYEAKLQTNKKIYDRDIKQLKDQNEKKIKQLNVMMAQKQHQLKQKYEAQIRSVALKNKSILQKKEKQYEGRITAVLSEKKTEEKLHEQTKIQASQTKQKLYNELYYEKKAKNQLQDQIENKCKFIKKLQKDISNYQVTLQIQKKTYEDRISLRESEVLQNEKKIVAKYETEIKNIKRYHYQELNKIQNRIQQLENIHREREVLWEQQNKEISSKLDQRPSKKEDLEIIEQYKAKLFRKQEQSKALVKELRSKMMQLENKQQTYNRIFTSSQGNRIQKRSLGRESFSRENLYKKAQTTDFKFLLKICNKQL